ncbi:MAG: excinuclease ABC subunit UvrA, partial [Candidatus Poribacteria bacterium]
MVGGRKGECREELEDALKAGFARARVDGQLHELTETIHLDRQLRHDIEIVVDRVVIKDGVRERIAESVETAVKLSGGLIIADTLDGEEMLFSQHYSCPTCATSYEEPTPQLFSFNSPKGACQECNGIGGTSQGSPDKVVPDQDKSIREGAIVTWGELDEYHPVAEGIAEHLGFSLDTPWKELPQEVRTSLLEGLGDARIPITVYRDGKARQRRWRFGGILRNIEHRYHDTSSDGIRRHYAKFMDTLECPECEGTRLRREAHAVKVGGKTIFDVTAMSVGDAQGYFETIGLTKRQATIAEQVLKEVRARLWFLRNVGLHYLSLNRTAPTLSGGESQRIRLASQIGTGLVGVLYILDEPSIGLHARDNKKLLDTLKHLRDIGNTIIIVEHDEETMRESDYIVDFGPGAGVQGGEVVVAGSPAKVMNDPASITGRYLSHERQIPIPDERRAPNGAYLSIRGARQNNLKGVDVDIPIGLFTCVTGVSGSGKSSLVNDILCKTLARDLMRAEDTPGAHDAMEGIEHLNKIITIDQSPIGRTPRSNPATYVKVWDQIRELYSQMPESRVRGYKPGRFSFNVKAGR